jgi:hypothetical protein
MNLDVQKNPLLCRADVAKAASQLLTPLLALLSEGKARLQLGDTGAVYPAEIAQMEAFARPLWAIIPMLAGDCAEAAPLWEAWREGISHGVDPEQPEYWGEVGDFDQRLVEMAVFGMGMSIAPEQFFFSLPECTRKQLYAWLNQINLRELPKNNWIFFRVLVNIGFETCGLAYSSERLAEDLQEIETHYEGDGWYFDYPSQRDYYTFWGFHYYGLIYSVVMRNQDPERAKAYRERAVQAARDFACWFDSSGEAVPYGRSLTYRFAQSAFFSAAAFAGAISDEVDYGVLKHLVLGNLRCWLRKPIFTRDGVLTIGYGYPNLLMAEGYNAPGSPYWAMKTFLCLALPESHPFWTATEKPFAAPEISLQPHAPMVVTRSDGNRHVLCYPNGNHAPEHAHDEAKYEKFAYSSVFGFSVPKAAKNLKAGAFDSTLAVSPDGVTYQTRYGCKRGAISKVELYSVWSPYPGVNVESRIFPLRGGWHVRIHCLTCEKETYVAEGGFAIARDGQPAGESCETKTSASFKAHWGISAIVAFRGYDGASLVGAEPNTNLMANRTLIPTLTALLPAGSHRLDCAVYGSPENGWDGSIPEEGLRILQTEIFRS